MTLAGSAFDRIFKDRARLQHRGKAFAIIVALPVVLGACDSAVNRASVEDRNVQLASAGSTAVYAGTIAMTASPKRIEGGNDAPGRGGAAVSRVSTTAYLGNGSYICSPSGFGKKSTCFQR